jgi:chemotaxis protein MotB
MVTFADLMTLLLTFFVLMLSFAEIDAIRFKRLAGELQKAFGVQRDIPADVIPMGTSPVLQKFSPGTPQPIPVDKIYQRLTPEQTTLAAGAIDSRVKSRLEAIEQQLEQTISEAAPEGNVAVERDGLDIIVRIDEQGSFPSGSAEISTSFRQLLKVLATELTEIPGYIAVDGPTDNVPIRSARFQSNWDLSAMRAATVTNALLQNPALEPGRFIVLGHADTRPIAPNDSAEQRANNRRVELIIRAGEMVERELGLRTSIEDPIDQAMEEAVDQAVLGATETDAQPADLNLLFRQALDAIGPTGLETFFTPELEAKPDFIAPDEAPIENDEPENEKPGQESFELNTHIGLGSTMR